MEGHGSRRRRSRRGEDDVEAYEKKPRSQKAFSKQLKNAFKLPIILPDGETVIPGDSDSGTSSLKKGKKWSERGKEDGKKKVKEENMEECNQDGHREVPVKMSRTQMKRLEALRKEFDKERTQKPVKQSKTKEEKELREIQECLKRTKTYNDVLKEIATTCEVIIADPQSNSYRFELLLAVIHGRWNDILKNTGSSDQGFSTKPYPSTLALLSMGSALQHCISGYALRLEVDSNSSGHVTSKTSAYEASLLKIYQAYVNILQERFLRDADVVVPIASGLLLSSPVFNYSNRLLHFIIVAACFELEEHYPKAVTVGGVALNCISTLIHQDSTLNITLHIVRELTATIKRYTSSGKHKYSLRGEVLRILSEIPFEEKETLVCREEAMRGRCDTDHIDTETCQSMMHRIVKEAHQHSNMVLDACVEALGRIGPNVPLALLVEMIEHLKGLALNEGGRLGPGVMFSAISSVVRMSHVASSKIELKMDTSWIISLFAEAVYQSLSRCLSSSRYASFTSVPTEFFFTNTSQNVMKERDARDHSQFLNQFKGALSAVCQQTSLLNTSSTCISKELVTLIQCLFAMACNVGDPVCRIDILDLISMYFKKYPQLKSLTEKDGAMLYGSNENISLFWEMALLTTWQLPLSETTRRVSKLVQEAQ